MKNVKHTASGLLFYFHVQKLLFTSYSLQINRYRARADRASKKSAKAAEGKIRSWVRLQIAKGAETDKTTLTGRVGASGIRSNCTGSVLSNFAHKTAGRRARSGLGHANGA